MTNAHTWQVHYIAHRDINKWMNEGSNISKAVELDNFIMHWTICKAMGIGSKHGM